MKFFNVRRFIADCGGVRQVASELGKTRTAPYRLIAKRQMSTRQIEQLLAFHPEIDVNTYFEDENANSDEARPEDCAI
jgi:DNA invertase Pin-like site-specific DNA recombinase